MLDMQSPRASFAATAQNLSHVATSEQLTPGAVAPNALAASLPTGAPKMGAGEQTIALPSGAGTPQGMGESFSAQPSTGAASLTVPIAAFNVRSGVQASLVLGYSSAGGHGIAGVGWNVGFVSISRQTDRGIPSYVDPEPRGGWHPQQDRFVFNGHDELVPICLVQEGSVCAGAPQETMPSWTAAGGWQYFRARVEGSFLRFFWSPDLRTWRLQDRQGGQMELGVPLDGTGYTGALETNPDDPAKIFQWNVVRQYDQHVDSVSGQPLNVIGYRYQQSGGIGYLSDIYVEPPRANAAGASLTQYAQHARLRYQGRPDQVSSYRRGWETHALMRLAGIDIASKIFEGGVSSPRQLVRRFHLSYDGSSHLSLLGAVQVEGRCATPVAEDAAESLPDTTGCPRLPPMTFGYSRVEGHDTRGNQVASTLAGFEPFDERVRSMDASPPHSLDETLSTLWDINSDALPDVLVTAPHLFNGKHGVYFNGAGGRKDAFGAARSITVDGVIGDDANVLKLTNSNISPQDLDGDGTVDLLHMPRAKKYATYTPRLLGTEWHWVGRAIETAGQQDPKIDFTTDARNTRVMDVNGDGLVDVVVSSSTEMETFLSLGRYPGGDGQFGQGTWLSASTASISTEPITSCIPWSAQPVRLGDADIRIADMNGDGLPDIVRVRPGDVRYWPGRGNGMWGTGRSDDCPSGTFAQNRQVAMETSPRFGVVQGTSLLFEDVNGDGLADLVEIRLDAVDIYLNVDGVGWTERHVISNTPAHAAYSNRVRLIDINGSGTPDILWGDGYNYRYIDLAGGSRPFLLTKVTNGLGKTTEIQYATSTSLMLAAEASSQPWSSKMPVVAHLVSRVTVHDNLERIGRSGGSYVTEYSYRDPVFDGREREFRGFRQSETRTIGDVNSPTSIARSYFLLGECKDDDPGDGVDPCAPSERWRDSGREALKGLPVLTEVLDERGVYLNTAHTTYTLRPLFVGLDGRQVRHVFSSASDTFFYDTGSFIPAESSVSLDDVLLERTLGSPQSDSSSSVKLRSTSGRAHLVGEVTVDARGHQTSNVAHGCAAGCAAPDEVITTKTLPCRPDGDTSGWLYRTCESWVSGSVRPTEQRNHSVFEHNAQGDLIRRRMELRDTETLDRFHETPGAQGNPPTGASVDGWIVTDENTVDAFGRVTKTIGPAGHCEASEYDAEYEHFLTAATVFAGPISAGGTCGSVAIRTRGVYDRGFGVAVDFYDARGERSHVALDGFGRVVANWDPDPTTIGAIPALPADRIEYFLPEDAGATPYTRVRHLAQDGADPAVDAYHERWDYVDGLGRTIASFDEADPDEDGASFIVDEIDEFDAKGARHRSYVARYYSGDLAQFPIGAAPTTTYASRRYDAFGRVLEQHGLDGALTSRTVFHALGKDLFDAADAAPGPHQGTPASYGTDGHGRTVLAIERIHAGSAIEDHHTISEYMPTGEVRRVTRRRVGGAGPATPDVVRWMRYDSLGRRILNVDPNTSKNFYANPDSAPPSGFHAWRYAYNDAGDLVGTSDARGCGVNYFYDTAGRLTAEDFSPCRSSQPPYSAPDLTPGQERNVEVLYRFDSLDSDTAPIEDEAGQTCTPTTATVFGRLASISDQVSKTIFQYDARGRSVCTAKKMAKPAAASPTLTDRYAPRWYVKKVTLDAANRPVRHTTGSSVAELAAGGESAVYLSYSRSGRVREASSSYGQLFSHVQRDASGLLGQVDYADAAATKRAFSYDQRQRLSSVQTYRGPPVLWNGPSATYFPPPPGAPPTQQLLLEDTDVSYDSVDNITEIRDWRLADEWPAGAKPVTRAFEYDDLYRLTRVAYAYPSGSDTWTSPFAAEEADATRTQTPSPHVAFANRALEQRYQYDWLGNTSRTTDDANGFYDRSIGQVTNGTASAGPYQLRTASNRAPFGSGGARAGDLDARYDETGNLTDLIVRRDGPCLPSGASCWQRFHYDWDEVGRLSSARRWDLAPGTERTLYADLQSELPPRAARPSDVELVHAYDSANNRGRKTAIDGAGHERHTLYPFTTLELRSTVWNEASPPDYALDSQTETVYLATPLVTARVVLVLNDEPSQTSGHQRVFLELADYLGSSSMVIDRETGELVERETYEAYGSPESDYRPARWGSFRENYQFTGKEADIEVGLVYFGQRYYAPSLSRWISADPLSVHELGDDLNLYAYVHGSVVNAVDPNGEIIIGIIAAAAIVGAVIGGVGGGITFAANGGSVLSWAGAGAILSGTLSGAAAGAVGAVAAPLGPVAAGGLAGAAGGGVGYLTGVPLTGGGFNYTPQGFVTAAGTGLATGAALATADALTGHVMSKLLGKGIEKAFNAVGVEIAGTGAAGAGAGGGTSKGAPGSGGGGAAGPAPSAGSVAEAEAASAPAPSPAEQPMPTRTPGPDRAGASPRFQKVLDAQDRFAETHPGAQPATRDAAGGGEKSSALKPGPYAKESIPAHPGKPTAAEQRQVNELMQKHGCHTCGTKNPGTKSGNAVADHQPPQKLADPKAFYPHCIHCARRQGGEVLQEILKRR